MLPSPIHLGTILFLSSVNDAIQHANTDQLAIDLINKPLPQKHFYCYWHNIKLLIIAGDNQIY